MKIHHKNRAGVLPVIAAFIFCGVMAGRAVGVPESGRGLFASPTGLLAYIDPGYGALIWQAVVASIIGATFYFRQWIRDPFGRRKAASASAEDAAKKNATVGAISSEPVKDASRPTE